MESYINQPTKIKISSRLYASGFSKIMWGLFLVILDFTIYANHLSIDLLPDIIGYFLFVSGCGQIAVLSKAFESAKAIAITLAICWFIDLVLPRDLQFGFSIVITILNCILIWHLMDGVAEFATSRNRIDLATKAKNRSIVYVIIAVGSVLAGFITSRNDLGAPLAILLFVAFVIVMVLILHLIYRVKNEVPV